MSCLAAFFHTLAAGRHMFPAQFNCTYVWLLFLDKFGIILTYFVIFFIFLLLQPYCHSIDNKARDPDVSATDIISFEVHAGNISYAC